MQPRTEPWAATYALHQPSAEEAELMQVVAAADARGLPVEPELMMAALRLEARRLGTLPWPTFADFVADRRPELLQHSYMRKQIAVAQRVLDGELTRVLVLLPTQYGKSEIWSRLLPAYWLLCRPWETAALASYGADLAWELSGDARDHYHAAGGMFREGSPKGSSRNWRTFRLGTHSGTNAGGMWATGVGGPALGRGWNLGVVDDPVDPEQAMRHAYQARFARWWTAKWLRGQRPRRNACVVVMQRLGPDDPIAYLLEREETEAAEHWHILALDEIKSPEPFARWDGPGGFPKTCTLEPDVRPIRAVLAPKWRSVKEVKHLQATAGPLVSAAQRQQRPMRPTGDFWKLRWFDDRTYSTLPPDAHDLGWDWDTAYSEEEKNAASAGVKTARGVGDAVTCRIYIEDLWWDWLEFPELIDHLKKVPGPHYVEQKASGKSAVQALTAAGVPSLEVPVHGNKLARATAAQPAVAQGRVYVHERVVQKLLYGESQGLLRITAEALIAGTGGLDLNDAFVQSVHRHLRLGAAPAEPKKKARFG